MENPNEDPDYDQDISVGQETKKPRKRNRKSGDSKTKEKGPRAKNQPSLECFTQRVNHQGISDACILSEVVTDGENIAEDLDLDRRKRRKTTPPRGQDGPVQDVQSIVTLDWRQQLQVEAGENVDQPLDQCTNEQRVPDQADMDTYTEIIEPSSNPPFAIPITASSDIPAGAVSGPPEKTPPRRILKMTNGKLVSPSMSKQPSAVTASPKKRRGRKKANERLSPTVTVIKYGSDLETRARVGQKIEDILNSPKRRKRAPNTSPKSIPKATEPSGPSKSTHPFFLGKPTAKKEEPTPMIDVLPSLGATTSSRPPPRGPRRAAITPVKLLREVQDQDLTQPMPAYGPIAGDPRVPRYPGMCEPLWPNKENCHVRNMSSNELFGLLEDRTPSALKSKKLKGGITKVTPAENILERLSSDLKPFKYIRNEDYYGEYPHPQSMRVPERLLTTGVNIQESLHRELSGALRHPALKSIFEKIENTLTPFDKGECEQQSWTNKYAPLCASHVLQTGKEACVLRDLLQNLTVIAVQGRTEGGKVINQSDSKRPTKKKRKKNEDDFIVDDFYMSEDEEMIELSDTEDFGERPNGRARLRSLKRSRASRNNNIILLSGPHGCGKSATVYAVAKELGFEIFEINSGSRRSGKDIQDKVGSMSENHLVTQQKAPAGVQQDPVSADDADNDHMSKALQDDLDSGRQGTMMSFFKPKVEQSARPKSQPKSKSTTTGRHPLMATPSAQSTLLPTKSQKQSLILLEEADVLFEEDQQFWAQIIKLASQSKRPIVITCNDESKIPVYDLPLGAILRLAPPPVDLATDYMLTLAAHEGHLLKRAAVHDLFESKNYDLRASISELDFWCQMSVGDRKGGLEWIYQRWPPGQDIDENGRILRVASQDTYQSSMGWLSNDVLTSSGNVGFDKEEELLKEAWTDWGIDPLTSNDLNILHPAGPSSVNSVSAQPLDDLRRIDCLLESVSAADIYCNVGLPSYQGLYDEPIDPTSPLVTEKDRMNYTVDLPVIQCPQRTDFAMFDTSMLIQVHKSNRRLHSSLSSRFICGTTQDGTPDLSQAILGAKSSKAKDISRSRPDFSLAFDELAAPANTTFLSSGPYNLVASSFDRTFRIVVEDLAPYIRAIVSHELRLETERLRVSNLLSEGGRSKRPRTTRASRVAIEGGTRETKRRETWFDKDLNRVLVMCTAGEEWTGLGAMADEGDMASRTGATESVTSTPETMAVVYDGGPPGLGDYE